MMTYIRWLNGEVTASLTLPSWILSVRDINFVGWIFKFSFITTRSLATLQRPFLILNLSYGLSIITVNLTDNIVPILRKIGSYC